MSRAMIWAGNQSPKRPMQKLVLLAYASHADKVTAECYPSVAALCAWGPFDRKTVMAATAELVGAGLLIDTGRRIGRTGQIKVYWLPIEAVSQTAPLQVGTSPETTRLAKGKSAVFPHKESLKRDTEHHQEHIPQKTSSSSGKRARAKQPHPMPEDFAPLLTAASSAIVAKWPPGMMERELAKCRDWHAKHGKLASDWQAAFRNWILTADEIWGERNEQRNSHHRLPAAQDSRHSRGTVSNAFARVERGVG